ncbi:LAME_0F10880g1_1 [Lachancea meyersii CBS 8951]|uniref:Guanine-nucleotide exchange factor YEL1 n=1 Tax=Lachancea meyersii CBS 8951 TaxID=1266667 RepID=A0A1G4JVX5_9SACH|nr:LAME_0F10880g1_1 [Lachancea meyersii CBS 8951]
MIDDIKLDCIADNYVSTDHAILIESPRITNIHEIVSESTSDSPGAKETAREILDGQLENVEFEQYANYLGSVENAAVLREFIGLLRPLPSSLTNTLRKLSGSIYFIAEAANIDAILEVLAKQWLEEHSRPHYQNDYRLCHIVLFALLMLNSALHNPVADCRFTLQDFKDNTINALKAECSDIDVACFEKELTKCFASLENDELPLLRPSTHSGPRIKNHNVAHTNRPINSSNMKKLSMLSIRANSLERTQSNRSSASSIQSKSTFASRDTTATSNYRMRNNQPLQKLYVDEPFDDDLQDLPNTPWFMDIVVQCQEATNSNSATPQLLASSPLGPKRKLFGWLRKHSKDTLFRENAHAAMTHTGYRARIRVHQGRLFVYRFKLSELDWANSSQIESWDLDTCRRNCSRFHVYNLYGTMASVVQENVVASEKSNFNSTSLTLEFPHGIDSTSGLAFRLQTRNLDEARKLAACLNFWTARITPIPSAQAEMISNEEYGWSAKVLDQKIDLAHVKLRKWVPLVSLDAIFPDLEDGIAMWDFGSQLRNLQNYTDTLGSQLDMHNVIKPRMVKVWSVSEASSHQRLFESAMDNWNNKYLYLNQQYSKHLIYLKALQNAVQFHHEYEKNSKIEDMASNSKK